ncbi:hypothetical protein [Acetobacterium bakii]|uniref:Uncharacterized protein n=1 Tax=Acetobacterium bakii TaxID=52689 RepID=A0A0L6TWF5_9FIRM|nr:hypothetical protein [Acetobacterium bakii]KNZ40609.1 hypothetical protein AKG39_16830 [Acetobacterium bakii]
MKKNGLNDDYTTFIIFIFTVFVILLPCLYFQENIGTSTIDATGILSFYGSIFGGFATLVAVVMSINHSKVQILKDRILSIKPYLQACYKPCEARDTIDHSSDLKEMYIAVDLTTNKIKSCYELPSYWDVTEDKVIKILRNKREHYLIEYTLSNVGAGNAVNLIMTINGEFNYAFPHMALPVNKSQTLFIRFSNLDEDLQEKCISLLFRYSDIHSKVIYEQMDEIVICRGTKNEDDFLSSRQEKAMKPPVELPDYTIDDLLKLI